jgi:bromodomain-containing factor 1
MDLPNYPKIIKKPMDLSTIRKKLDNGEYEGPQNFYEDFKLMIRNCFNFNPTGTPVNLAGSDLQRLFDEKWKNLPPLRAEDSEEDEDEVEDSEEDDRQSALNVIYPSVYRNFTFFDRKDRFARK